MNRRKFIKMSVVTAGATTMGGGAFYIMFKDSDPLKDFYESTEKVLAAHFGQNPASKLIIDIQQEYHALAPEIPYIGGEKNIFTEWLNFGAYYLAVYRALQAINQSTAQVGRIIYETFEVMADHPKLLLRLVGSIKYRKGFVDKLKRAAAKSLERKYPGDWVCTFIETGGEEFDYGLDITECGIRKFYRAQGADELTPYMCLSDEVVSKAFDRGLVRYKTIAEGAAVCDFRYKKGRETFVFPLRDGWPPKFINEKAAHS